MIIRMPGNSYTGTLPEMTEGEQEIQRALERHVRKLATDIGERHIWRPAALAAAATYIEAEFSKSGYDVVPQVFTEQDEEVRNLEVEIPGHELAGDIIVVGAHYDSVPDCPGANDNGSAVAALLELARLLAGEKPPRTLRFVAFVDEEPPFFHTDSMGSSHYARRCKERGENIVGMISLETIGFYSDAEGSQHYPFPFSAFYPTQGNFIGFVGNTASGDLVRQCIASFRSHTKFPSEGIAAPGWIQGIDWSDQRSFWQEGYPALMITDTAPFRYAYYHTPEDTAEKIDFARTARVVAGIHRMMLELAGI